MRIVDLSATLDLREVDSLLATDDEEQSVNKVVQDILNDVRKRKDQAVCEYTRRFDEFDLMPDLMRVPPEHIREYAAGADDELVEILRKAIHNIRDFHEQQVEESWEYYAGDGVRLGLRRTPIASAGVYIPGGKAAYPSSVLMNVIPAQVAGVERIVVVTPPRSLEENPLVAAALQLLNVHEILRGEGLRRGHRRTSARRHHRLAHDDRDPRQAELRLPRAERPLAADETSGTEAGAVEQADGREMFVIWMSSRYQAIEVTPGSVPSSNRISAASPA